MFSRFIDRTAKKFAVHNNTIPEQGKISVQRTVKMAVNGNFSLTFNSMKDDKSYNRMIDYLI